jgi:steroid delta-isomerase-like uncharacterized protein
VSELNKAVVRRFYEEVAADGDLGLIDQLLAPDYVERATFPGIRPGREGVWQFFGMMRRAFDEFRMEIDLLVAEDDLVAAHMTTSGVHVGEFLGVPPSYQHISVPTMDVIRFREGLAVEHWSVTDTGMLMRQLQALAPA